MGETSTDVAIVRGGTMSLSRSSDVEWGIPNRVPSLEIKSVGAGGGSILHVDSGGARSGPGAPGSSRVPRATAVAAARPPSPT